ncbi:MAG: di-heme oxidoredictase family protein [Cyclobacteriaceae bacterium]
MKNNIFTCFISASLFASVLSPVLFSCSPEEEEVSIYEEGEEFSGGAATVFDESVNAFGNAAPNLTGDKDLTFVSGNAFFKRNWVTAPSSTVDLDGLGPVFNARSCSGCHALDGRGRPPLPGEDHTLGLLFRLSVPGVSTNGGPLVHPAYGGQLNTRSILGVPVEATVDVKYVEVEGEFTDGKKYSLRMPLYEFLDPAYGEISDALVSPRVANHMVGLGLLEAISELDLISKEDPEDLDDDGISGRANRVWDIERQQKVIGRFGWKANQPTVRQQVAGAFVGDIGLTSSIFPDEPCTSPQLDCNEAQSGGSPEVRDEILDRVVLYSAALAVPKRRDWKEPEVLKGKQLFMETGCAGCHTPKWTTGDHPDFPEFSNQTIRPYTDLLLHDMGEALADNRPDFEASGREWRTPPLWGLGLLQTVNQHEFLLHDGRARGFEEAILWHGGEAQTAKEKYISLSSEDRQNLIRFLRSL